MITCLYAGILAVLYFKLSLDVIRARKSHRISLGDGPNHEIAAVVSAHHNFASYSFFLLLLLALLEFSRLIPLMGLHVLAAAFTLGRVLHYIAFSSSKMNFKLRVIGMHLTLWPLLLLGLLNLYVYFVSMAHV